MVAYEGTPSHDRARQLCERLLNRFWGDIDFEFSWWSFDFLRDSTMANAAAQAAAEAPLLIFSLHTSAEFPSSVRTWIEASFNQREPERGALAVLMEIPDLQNAAPKLAYLRRMAEQAHLDFLLQGLSEPELIRVENPPPEEKPTGLVTTELKRILSPKDPRSHWGINE